MSNGARKSDTVIRCILQAKFSGGYYEKDTPVPIPNTAVKLLSAHDTWLETARENRSPPDLFQSLLLTARGFVAFIIKVLYDLS